MGEEKQTSVGQCITLGAVSVPVLAWIIYYVIGWHFRFLVLAGLVLSVLAVALLRNPNPNCFLSSGRTPAATVSQELILKKKGGHGDSYWCDPSIAFGSLKDFRYTKGREVDFENLLKEKGDVIGPYCVDDESRSIVFVETTPEFDPAEVGPFYFQSQRDHAIRLYTVPFDEYHRVVAKMDADMTRTSDLLLVYNVSRCGSTLLSQCLNNLGNTRSISEPDVLTSLTHIAAEAQGTRDEDLIALTKSSAKLLCYLRRRRYPDCGAVCIKFRFQMVYMADLVNQALPDAKCIFLYRNGLDVIDSMGAAFINTGLYRFIRKIGLDTFYVYYVSSLPQNLWKLMPLMKDTERFPQSCYMWLGAVSPFVMTWISVMHYGMEAYRKGYVQNMIRYEDMIVGKTAFVAKMMIKLGMLKEDFDLKLLAEDMFNRDAHGKSSVTASSRTEFDESSGKATRKQGYAYLRGDDASVICSVLARHEEIERPDFIIPGTLDL